MGAIGVSAYSNISMVQRFGPIMRKGGSFVSLTYMASERVIPGYGGGMSSAKAALESDTRVLAFEAGRRWGHRVNCISAGPLASRAASAIGFIAEIIEYCKVNSPLPEALEAREVGATAAFLASPLGTGITGTTIYVDKGFSVMGKALSLVPDPWTVGLRCLISCIHISKINSQIPAPHVPNGRMATTSDVEHPR